MSIIRLPNGWQPRAYQLPLWSYLENGGSRAVAIWHRRAGKDDVALHWTACSAHERVGTYWHMLPQASQARKAIWNAVNPKTSLRRIDEAFPAALRANTQDHEMFMRFRSGSTWQVVGSDNFDSLVGSPPIGIVFSEWALADPRAWAILRPILDENGGWALFITTPRGRNHAHRSYDLAQGEGGWFGQILTAHDTPIFPSEKLAGILREYKNDYGEDDGEALFEQEYLCSFDAPLVGAFYAKLIAKAEQEGRVRDEIPVERGVPVQTAWDLGYSDDTTIWFFQVVAREIRLLDYYESHGESIEHYCKVLADKAEERGWTYGKLDKARHWVPWDAQPETLASGGRSIIEQAWACGVRMRLVPNLDVQDGIQATRLMLPRCWFDKTHCAKGLEAVRNYQREWDDDRKVFKRTPLHNWASHASDALRYLALAWREPPPPRDDTPKPIGGLEGLTIDRLWKDRERRTGRRARI